MKCSFDLENVVEVIEANKDIINNVEAGECSIIVHMNLGADKKRLVEGIGDMYNRFRAHSVDLSCDIGVRIFKFWWGSKARNI